MSPPHRNADVQTDVSALVARGWSEDEARRWVDRLHRGAVASPVLRPAIPGDGIHTLDPATRDDLARLGASVAATAGSFVPSSGAATRMCDALVRARRGETLGPEDGALVERVRAGWKTLPFADALRAAGADRDPIAALVDDDGLALPRRPKALVPFHDAVQPSPLAAHVRDARRLGLAGLHLTASVEHTEAFDQEIRAVAPDLAGLRVDVSTQDPRTDLPILAEAGHLVRDVDGRPVLRPGGHGALLGNLARAVVERGWSYTLLRNVDNTAPAEEADAHVAWRLALLGLVVKLERLASEAAVDPASLDALVAWTGWDADRCRRRLDRPFRVAGMVPSRGQPGGGPFWVQEADGASLQIVELVQIAPEDAGVVARATHFNPVEIALGTGRMGDPRRWIDPSAAILQRRRVDGVWVTMAEHPGLWNGSMAGWNTVFVEIPASMFHPVKTVADLLGRRAVARPQ